MADENNSVNSGVEVTVPEWINSTLIQKALHNGGEKDLQVTSVTVKAATAAGENFVSTLYRVKAALSDGSEHSYLVKGPPPGEGMAGMAKEMGIFRQEAFMLAEVVPQIEALLEEAAPGIFPPFAARCPLHGFDPEEFLVLEDLAPAGFKMADRKHGLDLHHSLLTVRSLARYHAASHALLRRQPEIADKLPNPWAKPNKVIDVLMESRVQAAIEACRSWPGFEDYVGLLEKFKPHVARTAAKATDLKPRVLDVIVHGDFWVNNMLFRYEDEDPKPRGYRLVDFQLCSVSSPAIDLLMFLSTSVNDNVSENKEDVLIHEYYTTLKETLALFRLKAPSMEAFLADMNARGVYALFCTMNWLPHAKAHTFDIEATIAGDISSAISNLEVPAVKKWMQRIIPEYRRKGWLQNFL